MPTAHFRELDGRTRPVLGCFTGSAAKCLCEPRRVAADSSDVSLTSQKPEQPAGPSLSPWPSVALVTPEVWVRRSALLKRSVPPSLSGGWGAREP